MKICKKLPGTRNRLPTLFPELSGISSKKFDVPPCFYFPKIEDATEN
jgi:hypothetical protein